MFAVNIDSESMFNVQVLTIFCFSACGTRGGAFANEFHDLEPECLL